MYGCHLLRCSYNILYFLYNEFFIILYNIIKITQLDCCQIIILSIYAIQKEIEQLSLSVSKRAAEKDRELPELYLQQGAIPRNVQNKIEQASAPPVKESSAPPLKTVIGQTE